MEASVRSSHTTQRDGSTAPSRVPSTETSAKVRHPATAAAALCPVTRAFSRPKMIVFTGNRLPITAPLDCLDILRGLAARGANPCLIAEGHDSIIPLPAAALDAKKNLGHAAQVDGPCSQRLGVGHQRNRPCAGTHNRRVKGRRFHLPA